MWFFILKDGNRKCENTPNLLPFVRMTLSMEYLIAFLLLLVVVVLLLLLPLLRLLILLRLLLALDYYYRDCHCLYHHYYFFLVSRICSCALAIDNICFSGSSRH